MPSGASVLIEFEIYYNQKDGFYALLPPQYNANYDMLDADNQKKFSVKNIYKGKYSFTSKDFKRAVSKHTERECEESMKELIRLFLNSAVTKRNVIILFFSGSTGKKEDNFDRFSQVSANMHFVYAVETKISDNQPVYNVEFGNATSRVDMGRYNKPIILDDTPEYREFIESLYSAMNKLVAAMGDFTKTRESFISLIESKQKLLPG